MLANYRSGILPHSQDMLPVIEETAGLYGISSDSLKKYKCRIGRKPYMHIVNKYEVVDINTEEDLLIAEFIGNIIYNKYIKEDINYEKGINNRWSRIYRK